MREIHDGSRGKTGLSKNTCRSAAKPKQRSFAPVFFLHSAQKSENNNKKRARGEGAERVEHLRRSTAHSTEGYSIAHVQQPARTHHSQFSLDSANTQETNKTQSGAPARTMHEGYSNASDHSVQCTGAGADPHRVAAASIEVAWKDLSPFAFCLRASLLCLGEEPCGLHVADTSLPAHPWWPAIDPSNSIQMLIPSLIITCEQTHRRSSLFFLVGSVNLEFQGTCLFHGWTPHFLST